MMEEEPQREQVLRDHKDEEDISELSERLAPLEEKISTSGSARRPRADDGALVIDTGKLTLPKGFEENEPERRGKFGLDPTILIILTMLIAFILMIAYLVYKMPTK